MHSPPWICSIAKMALAVVRHESRVNPILPVVPAERSSSYDWFWCIQLCVFMPNAHSPLPLLCAHPSTRSDQPMSVWTLS